MSSSTITHFLPGTVVRAIDNGDLGRVADILKVREADHGFPAVPGHVLVAYYHTEGQNGGLLWTPREHLELVK